MKIFYIFSCFVVIIVTDSVSQLQRCACQDYPAALCTSTPYCTWTGNECGDLICSSLYQEDCRAVQTEYKCIWNEQQCEDYTYKCSELTSEDCTQYYGLDCIVNQTTQQCVDYNCSDISDIYYCDPTRCSFIQGICGDPVNQDCSALTTCDGNQFNGDSKLCITNDLGVCKSYNYRPQSCSEFNDSQNICNNHSCTYDETNQICQQISCSAILTENLCSILEDDINKIRLICSWNGDTCENAQPQLEIKNFAINECIQNSADYCTWDLNSQQYKSQISTRGESRSNHFSDYQYYIPIYMKIFYILCLQFFKIQTETLSSLQRCACQEYAAAICSFILYCTWTGEVCTDVICSSLPQRKCEAYQTEYKCIWNEEQKQCEEHQYECSELSADICPQYYGLDCIVNQANQKCLNFSCSQIDSNDQCDPARCSLINDQCADPVDQDCSALSTCDGTQYNGDSKKCYTNDFGVCKPYNSSPQSCTEFNDSKELCNNHSCKYDETNQICQEITCSDLIECQMIYDEINKNRQICIQNGDKCQAAASNQAQFQNYTLGDCLSSPTQLCTWDLDTQKCKQCMTVIPNPQIQNIKYLGVQLFLLINMIYSIVWL